MKTRIVYYPQKMIQEEESGEIIDFVNGKLHFNLNKCKKWCIKHDYISIHIERQEYDNDCGWVATDTETICFLKNGNWEGPEIT